MGELDGKVAIVTGGANGIGRGIAELFLEEGARVLIADIDAEAGATAAAELGDGATSQETDVGDPDSIRAAIEAAQDRFGGLHVMVNNAGISGSPRRLLRDDLRDFSRVMSVDLLGVIAGTQQAALAMEPGGSIVNVTSIAGIVPGIGFASYRAAKAGVVHFSRCAAIEVAEVGVRVNVIAPANIATDINAAFDSTAIMRRIQPLQRQGTTRDVANAAVYLGSDRSAQVTGMVLPVDGGTTAGPPPIDHRTVAAAPDQQPADG